MHSVNMAQFFWICLSLWLAPACVFGYTPIHKFLYDNCGTGPNTPVISVSRDVVVEFSRFEDFAPAHYQCQVRLRNTDRARQLQVRFRYLDLLPSANCSQVGLALQDGTSYLTPPNGVCGTSKPLSSYRSSGQEVTVTLANRGTSQSFTDFELLVTAVYASKNGSCQGTDFRCNNGLCIPVSLACNAYNDCGDDSDEIEGCSLAVGVIVGVAFAAFFFLAFLAVLGVVFRRRRRLYIRVSEPVREYPTVNTVTYPQPAGNYVPSYAIQKPGGYQNF